jgi:hypothetical protein
MSVIDNRVHWTSQLIDKAGAGAISVDLEMATERQESVKLTFAMMQ